MTESLATEYLSIQKEIKDRERRAEDIRDQLMAEMKAEFGELTPAMAWCCGDTSITVVKGRTTTKIDRKKLVRLGVTAEVLEKATTVTTGQPTLRIEGIHAADNVTG